MAGLEHELGLGHLTARILAARGIDSPELAERFLAKRLADCNRPALLRGMDTAATRLAQAIDQRQRILIHGDYDVDGSTGTTLLVLFCRACRHDATGWIPHRRIDGYGLGESSLEAVREHRAQLMITVDCGIADGGWARRIEAETGCDVIITDHHLPQGQLPACTAVVNPNHPDCTYPDKGLAGVGVAWKLAWATAVALTGQERLPNELRSFLLDALALVAVGTVADCAPLDDENRILIHHGLAALAQTTNPGLRALIEQARLGPVITAADIGWRIGPLLNAAGRVGSAMRNIDLLTATNPAEAQRHLQAVVSDNDERRRLSQLLTEELMAEVEANPDRYASRSSLVFAGEGWHQGVVGIVASRLTERFGKPTAVIAIEDGTGKGSLRSIPDIHLGRALDGCRHLLLKGGGHAMAAGLSIDPDNVAAFGEVFDEVIRAQQPGGIQPPGIEHDGDSRVADLDRDFFADLSRLAPFGQGNPEPVLRLVAASFVTRPEVFGRTGEHLRGALTDTGGGLRQLYCWKARDQYPGLSRPGGRFELLVKPEVNRWRGETQERLVLVDTGRDPD